MKLTRYKYSGDWNLQTKRLSLWYLKNPLPQTRAFDRGFNKGPGAYSLNSDHWSLMLWRAPRD
jgi:hypothetical protein